MSIYIIFSIIGAVLSLLFLTILFRIRRSKTDELNSDGSLKVNYRWTRFLSAFFLILSVYMSCASFIYWNQITQMRSISGSENTQLKLGMTKEEAKNFLKEVKDGVKNG